MIMIITIITKMDLNTIYIIIEVKMGYSTEAIKQLEALTGLDLHSKNDTKL